MARRHSHDLLASHLELSLACLMLVEGWSYHQAGRALGHDAGTIRRWALRLGFPSRNRVRQGYIGVPH